MTGDHTLHRLTDFSSFGAAYHDGTYLHVPGYEIIDAAGGTVSRKLNTTQFNLADGDGGAALKGTYSNYHCIGITVNFNFRSVSFPDNQWAKKLYIKHHWQDNATTHQQLFIKCYDSAGNVLGGTSPAYVQGHKWAAVGTGAGQLYTIQFSSPTNPIIFHGDVAKVFIGAFNYEAMNGLEIYAPYQANGYLSYTGPKELPGILYAANAPTKWHFQVGEKVLNDAAAVGAPQGWVCIKRTSTTLSANASGGDVTITVASITGIASGDIIGVKLNTGLYHFTTVNGAPAGSTVTLTAALPGTGVVATSGNAVVANLWQAMPNL
ncbi:MAG: hypothetical protein Q7U74_04400, partial [Saprospiraceae bacterium]|nr:hypothetical protein [Saprospiraceae bacterium]